MVNEHSRSHLLAWVNAKGLEKRVSGEKTSNCTGGIALRSLLTGPRLEKSSANVVKTKFSTASVTGCLSLLRERSDMLN